MTAGGVRTPYLDAGPPDAPVVVALHGLGATNASLLPTVWELGRDHRVIAPDLPGFGIADKPLVAYSAAWFGSWLERFCDELGLDRFFLLGNSLGGRVAIEGGLLLPDRVRALVLLTPSPAFRRLRQFVPVVRVLRPELAVLPLPVGHATAVAGLRRMFAVPDRIRQSWYDAAADEFLRVMHDPRGGSRSSPRCARSTWRRRSEPAGSGTGCPAWSLRRCSSGATGTGWCRTGSPATSSRPSPAASRWCCATAATPQFELPRQTHRLVRSFLTGAA